MITPSQSNYYNTLSDESKLILQAAALKSCFYLGSEFQTVVSHFCKKSLSQKYLKPVLDDAVKAGLFYADQRLDAKYTVALDFLIFVFPEINITPAIWDKIRHRSSYYDISVYKCFCDCLYALLYQPAIYKKEEQELLKSGGPKMTEFYTALLEHEHYHPYLHLISRDIIHSTIHELINKAIRDLTSFRDLRQLIDRIETLSGYSGLKDNDLLEINEFFWKADLTKAIDLREKCGLSIFGYEAIKYLLEGNAGTALDFFSRQLKLQYREGDKLPFPSIPHLTYFYFVTLLLSDNSVSTSAFQKIAQWTDKKSTDGFHIFFVAIVYDFLNEKESLSGFKKLIKMKILYPEMNYYSLINMLICYIIGDKIEERKAEHIYGILKKAVDADYLLLAYEAAFVANKWFSDKKFKDLYQNLSDRLNYQPAVSRIDRQEDWEKSLNILLGFKSKKGSGKADKTESSARIVYYFNPQDNTIQPVLQTRQVKGWSKGRNIAMKTFHSADVKGMTDHDLRISKCVKMYAGYYDPAVYEFEQKVFVELIGHPYVFLENSNDIPVEFIAGQAVVSVKKTANVYRLSTDLKLTEENILVERETNTRYKIYTLSSNQQRIIKIINDEKLLIPESGKAKLSELLGTLSAEGFAVHSDLVASVENRNVEIREIPADSRIRVQILPFGDGLKAELYSKPFGDRPPYCKAGKGGKMLVSNEKNVQLQVKRDLKQETENEQALLNEIQSLETLNDNDGLFSFDDPLDSLYLLDILKNKQEICVVEWAEGERYRLRHTADINQMSINISGEMNWFDLQGELRVDENTVISLQQLLALTEKSHDRFIELSSGEFLALSNRLKKQLDNLRMFSASDKKGVRLNKFASVAMGDFFDEMKNVKTDKKWKEFKTNLEKAKTENAEIPENLNAELRAYQEEGFRWMARLAEWNAGSCLADDMGLGKTVQALALLLHRAKRGSALVVCPVSVINNWIAEAERFAPDLRFKILGTSASDRKSVLQNLKANDVLVTSYGLLQSEEKLFAETEFATAILDEAHMIKNYATKTSKAIMQLKADFRLTLTGTPVQNHLGEIWNLFNFINPGLLGSLQHFNDTFIKNNDEKSKKYLKKLITPFILRRTKNAVLEELPPKTEIVKKITLSAEETAFYEALRRQALENLSNSDETKHIQVLAEIMKLRQASCNPLLIDKNIHIPSSKLAAFLDIIGELIENKHRALVFSQFVTHLSIVRDALDKQGINYRYIDGSTSQKEREQNVRKFQDGEGELFLISLKAGGLGLNLTAADYVLHLDPWWNPAVEDQASDRAHRIGQQRPVTIYRLVAENTIEEKILQLHAHKRDLAEQLLEGSDMAAKLSVKEMIALISEGDVQSLR
jgi:SNF2 family DNA or RNA helicase